MSGDSKLCGQVGILFSVADKQVIVFVSKRPDQRLLNEENVE